MSTLSVLFESLAAARRAGEPFDAAWQAASMVALGSPCDADDWEAVLGATVGTWRSAYEDLPASRHERALSLLVEGVEAAGVDGETCRRCSGPIPAGRRRSALYCGNACRRLAHAERGRIAA
jgi:hypothetical protein